MLFIGLDAEQIKLANSVKSEFTITKEGDKWHLLEKNPAGNTDLKFKMDERFDKVHIDGIKTSSVINLGQATWEQQQEHGDGGPEVTINRRFEAGVVTIEYVLDSCEATRVYHKVF